MCIVLFIYSMLVPSINLWKKINTLYFLKMTENSAALSTDLANNFLEAEESKTQYKEPTLKNIQAENRQSNNKMMQILKYMKSGRLSLKRNQALHKKRRFPLRVSSVNVIKSALSSDLVAFTDQILNRKLHLMCSVIYHLHKNLRHRSLLEP